MQTSAFDFDLPEGLIAQRPMEPRDHSRLMVLRRDSQTLEHRRFLDLPDLLNPGDILVRNNTRVVPARLLGHRQSTGGRWEGLFLRARPDGLWQILASTRGKPIAGEIIVVEGGLRLELIDRTEDGGWLVRPENPGDPTALLNQHGHIPLPPYIRKGRDDPEDRLRYQTVYAKRPGAVAAPTAGLHFTERVIESLEAKRITSAEVTLHVGLGTFRPIEAENIEDHTLHAEWAEVSEETARSLNQKRLENTRIIAVGTTSARTLETAARTGHFEAFAGETALYLQPGHVFHGLDALITNFHLPKSSLLVLVSALAGVEFVRSAYQAAIRQEYRFYSYGDAMIVL